jgi:hypothetical protein
MFLATSVNNKWMIRVDNLDRINLPASANILPVLAKANFLLVKKLKITPADQLIITKIILTKRVGCSWLLKNNIFEAKAALQETMVVRIPIIIYGNISGL